MKELDLNGIIIKDIDFDTKSRSLQQNISAIAQFTDLVIIENTNPSGHLTELNSCIINNKVKTAVIQEKGKGSTYMVEEDPIPFNFLRKFEYDSIESICALIYDMIKWKDKYKHKLKKSFKKIYPWRSP